MVAAEGTVVATAGADYPLLTPRPGWTEQEPEAWWRACCAVLRALREKAPGPIAALGLTGQMHGAVFLDDEGRVIRPAILWNDQRTAAECVEIERRVGAERLRRIAGNPALTGFQAPKALWLRHHEPAAYARIRHLLLPKDFIRFRLTGALASDASDAAGTLLLDLAARDWSAELLGALEIPRAWLPRVHEGPEVTGQVSAAGAAASGLPEGLPVVAGGGDNAAAAVGCGAVRPGTGFVSLGTSGVVFVPSAGLEIDPSGALHAFCHAVPGQYHLMGVVLSAGGSLRWYQEVIGAPPGTGGGPLRGPDERRRRGRAGRRGPVLPALPRRRAHAAHGPARAGRLDRADPRPRPAPPGPRRARGGELRAQGFARPDAAARGLARAAVRGRRRGPRRRLAADSGGRRSG